jgi:hypothetical protein
VRFEITVVSVLITFAHVKIGIRVEITRCVYNFTCACRYQTRECQIHTHTCQNYFRVSGNYTLRVNSHSACGIRTLRVEINLVRVGITFVPVEITPRVEITHSHSKNTFLTNFPNS